MVQRGVSGAGQSALPVGFAIVITVVFGRTAIVSVVRFASAGAIVKDDRLIARNPTKTLAIPWTSVRSVSVEPWTNGVAAVVHCDGEEKPLRMWALATRPPRARVRLACIADELNGYAERAHMERTGAGGVP
jgi:hypothetical protein